MSRYWSGLKLTAYDIGLDTDICKVCDVRCPRGYILCTKCKNVTIKEIIEMRDIDKKILRVIHGTITK